MLFYDIWYIMATIDIPLTSQMIAGGMPYFAYNYMV